MLRHHLLVVVLGVRMVVRYWTHTTGSAPRQHMASERMAVDREDT